MGEMNEKLEDAKETTGKRKRLMVETCKEAGKIKKRIKMDEMKQKREGTVCYCLFP